MSRRKIKRITILILLIGLGGALAIYLTATPAGADPFGYDPMADKKYVRELRLYGGSANVLSAEFMEWFAGLWRGESLAFTIAVITIGVAWIFWFLATRLGPGDDGQHPV